MARILLVEDDPTVREHMRLHLEAAGFDVRIADDGAAGLRLARLEPPDLVLSEIRIPGLDGFSLLAALRADSALSGLPFIFVTADDRRETFRAAMNRGADDLLPKPVAGDELVRAVQARLVRLRPQPAAMPGRGSPSPRIPGAPLEGTGVPISLGPGSAAPSVTDLMKMVTATSLPPVPQLASPLPVSPLADRDAPVRREIAREPHDGTLLWLTVRNGSAMASGFSALERQEVLQSFFAAVCEPILAEHGYVIRHNARELIAAFESEAPGSTEHAGRAVRAALYAILAVSRFRSALRARARLGSKLDFAVGIALDSGSYQIVTTNGGYAPETTVDGRMARALEQVDPAVIGTGWSVAASDVTVRAAGEEFVIGRAVALAADTETAPTMLIEITGLDGVSERGSGASSLHDAVLDAIHLNGVISEVVAQGKSAAIAYEIPLGVSLDPVAVMEMADIPGYELIRKLGSGGMSRVYLARHLESGAEHVLKVVRFAEDDEDMLQRFIQEYALIAQVRHPNVARIFGQGFAASCAYIAMEYLDGGDLRDRIAAGIPYPDAVNYLTQTALALTAIHDRGIVHRDLKPENLMLRADGALVLADFGIAKQLSTALTRTRHGEVFGTPFYMSPEQAQGDPIDGRSDLYALGVIFHEMLTGEKPFTATRAEALVYQHLHSDIPTLPGKFWRVQPILDRLLAKDPRDRFASALELLRSLREAPASAEGESALATEVTSV